MIQMLGELIAGSLFEFIDAEYKIYSQEQINKIEAIRDRLKTVENV